MDGWKGQRVWDGSAMESAMVARGAAEQHRGTGAQQHRGTGAQHQRVGASGHFGEAAADAKDSAVRDGEECELDDVMTVHTNELAVTKAAAAVPSIAKLASKTVAQPQGPFRFNTHTL